MKKIDIDKDYSKLRGSTQLHNELKNLFTIMVNRTFPDVTIVPYDVAFVRAYSNPDICFRVGEEGVPDLIVFGNGYYLFFDAKTGKNKFQENQKVFASVIQNINKGKNIVFKLSKIRDGLKIISQFEELANGI